MIWDQEYAAAEHHGEASVLVGIVPRLADWDMICREHWYRIPVDKAPKRLAAEYLAFYHPKVFPELRWTITYYAPVKDYDILPRRELVPQEPEHPRADKLYYRIAIGELRSLPKPIPSKRLRRITFIATTLSRLFTAQEINDLWLPREPKQALWRDLQLSETRVAYKLA